jgi:hypothetical protein
MEAPVLSLARASRLFWLARRVAALVNRGSVSGTARAEAGSAVDNVNIGAAFYVMANRRREMSSQKAASYQNVNRLAKYG